MPSLGLSRTLPFTLSSIDFFGRAVECVKTFALMSSDPLIYNDGAVVDAYALEFDGTQWLDITELDGSETVVNSEGSAVPSVAAGRVDFTSGRCSYLELSNGSVYELYKQSLSDASSNGYDATAVNSPQFVVDNTISRDPNEDLYPLQWGRTGAHCLSFNGIQRVEFSNTTGTGEFDVFSMGAWFNTTQATNGYIISTRDDTSGGVSLYLTGGRIAVVVGLSVPTTHPDTVNDGEWHYAQIDYKGGQTYDLTVDGVKVSGASSTSFDGSKETLVGARRSGANGQGLGFVGEISNPFIAVRSMPLSEGVGSVLVASDGTIGTAINSPTWVLESPVHTNAEEGFELWSTPSGDARVAYVNGSPNPFTPPVGWSLTSSHPAIGGHNNSEDSLTAKVTPSGEYPPRINNIDFPPADFRPQDGAITNVYWRTLPQDNYDRITLVEESALEPDEFKCLTDYLTQGTGESGINTWLDSETWDDNELWVD